MTYGQIARIVDSGPRAVGQFLHRNTDPKKHPCHRVVFSDGSLAAAYVFGGEEKQRELLVAEGVEFSNGKVEKTFFEQIEEPLAFPKGS